MSLFVHKKKWPAVGIFGLAITIVLMSYQNCAQTGFESASLSSIGDAGNFLPPEQRSFSTVQMASNSQTDLHFGYQFPKAKFGIYDFRWPGQISIQTNQADIASRYDHFAQRAGSNVASIGSQVKNYNIWWSGLEPVCTSGQTSHCVPISSSSPLTCPVGFVMVPANSGEKQRLGFNKYHCYYSALIEEMDYYFKKDAEYGLKTTVVLYSAPTAYQGPCIGGRWGADAAFKLGCFPSETGMSDYQDYVNFLSSRYNGQSGLGKIHHYIVWNENNWALWSDISGYPEYAAIVAAAKSNVNYDWESAYVNLLVKKYANLFRKTQEVVKRHVSGVLMFVPIDNSLEPVAVPSRDKFINRINDNSITLNIGGRELVEGLFRELGLGVSWAVAVHPYGDVVNAPSPGHYNFTSLKGITDALKGKVREILQAQNRGNENPLNFPQSYVMATEQGAELHGYMSSFDSCPEPTRSQNPRRCQARWICLAHDIVNKNDQIIATTHNYFQTQRVGPEDQGGFILGLLPRESADSLSDLGNYETGKAMLATSPKVWGLNNTNYCCQNFQVGCSSMPANPGQNPSSATLVGTLQSGKVSVRFSPLSGDENSQVSFFVAARWPDSSKFYLRTSAGNWVEHTDNAASNALFVKQAGFSGGNALSFDVTEFMDLQPYRGVEVFIGYGKGSTPFVEMLETQRFINALKIN